MKNFLKFDPRLLTYGFFITFFASYGQTFFISLFNFEIRNIYQLSDGEFGLIYALATLLSASILVGFAKLIDFIDLRLYSLLISTGLALACFGIFFLYKSFIFIFIIIFALRFFLGKGAMSHAGETTMARYFGNNRGKAISIGTFGAMIGMMLWPIIVIYLLNFFNWQLLWLFFGLSIFVIFIPLLFIALYNQTQRHEKFTKDTKEFELGRKWKTREVLLDKKFYVYLPLSLSGPFIGTGLQFHQIYIISEKGWSLQMLANGFVLLGMFSLFGLVIGGPIIDKFNTKKVIIYTLVPLMFSILTLMIFDNYLALYVYMSFLGFKMGISAPFHRFIMG